MALTAGRYLGQLVPIGLSNFAGGLNLRDAADELGPSESPDLWNVTFDERGGVGARLGGSKYNANAFAAALVKNVFEWKSVSHIVTQCGPSLYLDTSTTAFKTFTTSARCGFADFLGKLVVVHPVDGLFVSDGTGAGTSRALAGPKGSTLAVWQNRLWVAGDGTSSVFFSAIGSATQWFTAQTTLSGSTTLPTATITVPSTAGFTASGSLTITDGSATTTVGYTGVTTTTFTGCTGGSGTFAAGLIVGQGALNNKLREIDDTPVVCLKGASGEDIQGQPGLLAFKRRSAYRITDSATGAYLTIDAGVGAASALAVEAIAGRVYAISEQGVFYTSGTSPMVRASDKIQPLFDPAQVAFDQLDLWCAGKRDNRLHFSLPRVGQTANNLALEHSPDQGWFAAGSNAAACYANGGNARVLLAGSPSVNGRVYTLYSGGTDDGAAISAYFESAAFRVFAPYRVRLRSLVVEGRGDGITVDVRKDYSRVQGTVRPVTFPDEGTTRWDESTWDGGTWSEDKYVALSDAVFSLGVARAFSFRFSASTSVVANAPALLGGASLTVGAWAVYGLDLQIVPLTSEGS